VAADGATGFTPAAGSGTQVARQVDANKFLDLLVERLATAR
jgi:hypothetical protein